MTVEEKAKAYDEAMGRAKKELNACGSQDCDAAKQIFRFFPELKESEDEKVRRGIIDFLWKEKIYLQEVYSSVENIPKYRFVMDAIAWLEKQKDINSKEYVFRPLAGCDINTAAIQAVEQQKLRNKIVLAFNGAYIPVEEKTANDIVNEYYSWVEKQSKQKSVDINVSLINKMAKDYKNTDEYVDGEYKGKPINCMVRAYRQGIKDILSISKENPIKPAWSEEDDKQLDIAMESCQFLNKIETVNWLKSLKDRLKGE